ncbi:hypothetical protein HN388_04570 [bacterium]|jgi:hypothetical protein|nr:hypothetical protein [bacterium]MBT4292146.1 hypothetical protein [bacterium]MBT7311638.1 hypothetical protein [bacterium]
MIRRNIMGLLICIATLGVATLGYAGIPHMSLSSAATAAAVQVSLFSLPDGSGKTLDAAKAQADPVSVDATVTLTLRDGNDDPISAYPGEDIEMASTLGGFVACAGGAAADASTDAAGLTTFSGSFNAGGFSAAGEMAVVTVDGLPLVGSNLNILFNSADLDASGLVDLSDAVTFSTAYQGVYDYKVDFFFDGSLSLSDIVLFAGGYSAVCP